MLLSHPGCLSFPVGLTADPLQPWLMSLDPQLSKSITSDMLLPQLRPCAQGFAACGEELNHAPG